MHAVRKHINTAITVEQNAQFSISFHLINKLKSISRNNYHSNNDHIVTQFGQSQYKDNPNTD